MPLVDQWLRLHLPMQGTQVWPLVGELGSHMPWGQLSPQAPTREASAPQGEILHATMKILSATAKTQHSQINKYFD